MTDTLKLGHIIEPGRDAERDAIHVAVVPVVANERLLPAQPVGVLGGGQRAFSGGPHVGIVDPFLAAPVEPSERFWLWLTPGTVTGMRHDWTHPAFAAAKQSSNLVPAPAGQPVAPSSPRWRNPTVLGIVRQMREANSHAAAPILADALEDADFDDADVLAALRKQVDEKDWYERDQHKQAVARALDMIEDDGSAAFSEQWLRRYAVEHNPYDVEDFHDKAIPGGAEAAFKRLVDGLKTGELFFHGSDLHSLDELDDAEELRRHGERYLRTRIDWSGFNFSCSC